MKWLLGTEIVYWVLKLKGQTLVSWKTENKHGIIMEYTFGEKIPRKERISAILLIPFRWFKWLTRKDTTMHGYVFGTLIKDDNEKTEAGWDITLNDYEISRLVRGISPLLIRPQHLVVYHGRTR